MTGSNIFAKMSLTNRIILKINKFTYFKKSHLDERKVPTPNSNDFVGYMLIGLVFLMTFGVSAAFAPIMPEPHHDGVIFKSAVDLLEGKILFKETASQYGPFCTILQALALKAFGRYLIVIRLLTAFFYGLISIMLLLIWSRFLPKWLNFISFMIWLLLSPYYVDWLMPWSSVYALFFQLSSIYMIILFLEKDSGVALFMSGFCAALAFWTRQPVGILLCGGISVFLFSLMFLNSASYKNIFRNFVNFVSGLSFPSAVFLIWLLNNDSLRHWYLQNIEMAYMRGKYSLSGGVGLDNIFATLLPHIFGEPMFQVSFFWTVLPIVSFAVLIAVLVKMWSCESINKGLIILYAVTLAALSSWLQYYPLPDLHHVYWAATPMIGLLSYFVWKMVQFRNTALRAVLTSSILGMVCFGDIRTHLYCADHKIHGPGRPYVPGTSTCSLFDSEKYVDISNPEILRGMKARKEVAELYDNIAQIIEEYVNMHPDLKIITDGPDALYLCFVENSQNFHPFFVMSEPWRTRFKFDTLYMDYDQKLGEYVRSKRPLILTDISSPQKNHYDDYIVIANFERPIASNCAPFGYMEKISILAPIETVVKINNKDVD